MRPSDESQLIERAKQHDPEAISELYQHHIDRVYRYIRYRVHDAEVTEDITSDVFMRALEGLAAFDDRGVPFEAWLYRIAHARVIDYWRHQRRWPTVQIDDPALIDWLRAEDNSEDDVLQRRSLLAALRQLTDDQQQVIVLKFMAGCDNAEIAHIVDKTEGAVKALQRRGLEALSRLLDE